MIPVMSESLRHEICFSRIRLANLSETLLILKSSKFIVSSIIFHPSTIFNRFEKKISILSKKVVDKQVEWW